MAEVKFLTIKCQNPACGQLTRLSPPAKSGIYNVKCPHCGTARQYRITGTDDMATRAAQQSVPGTAPAPQAADNPVPAQPAMPDNSRQPVVELKDDFIVGVSYAVKCPHCGRHEIGFTPDRPGYREIYCNLCKGRIGISARNKTEVIVVTQPLQRFRGKLILLRRGWLNKDYPLSEGKNIIGRLDETAMSDISIENDSSMSRRSVEIEVKQTDRGYMFKLTVLKAANPVLHNNRQLPEGDSVSLNFGDSIIMGKTKFRFDKDV